MKKLNLRFDAVDFLRIIAMFCVIFLHFVCMFDPPSWWAIYNIRSVYGAPAWSGVTIFFFVSAYLNVIGFVKGKYPFTFKGIMTFYKKRLLKILIDYYILLAILILVFYRNIFVDDLYTFFRLIFCFYDGTTNVVSLPFIGHLWFVSTIVQFYLICPLIAFGVYKIKDKKNLLLILFFVVLAVGQAIKIPLIYYKVGWHKYIYTPVYSNLDFFICGALFYAYNRDRKNVPLWLQITSIVVFVGVIYANSCFNKEKEFITQAVFPSLVILSSAFVLFSFPETPKDKPYYYPSKILSAISYHVYLLHPIIGTYIITQFSNLSAPAVLAVVALASLASFLGAGIWVNLKWATRKGVDAFSRRLKEKKEQNESC